VSGDPTTGYYYGNYISTYLYGYQFPLEFVLYMNETVQQGTGVWVYTGVQLLENGSSSVGSLGIVWFDKILIVDPNATSASFVVTGKQYTPVGSNTLLGSFYDTEVVFGGDLGGQSANFTSLNADLSLFYYNQTVRTYPSVYAFGTDTAEAAYNLQSTYSGNEVTLSTRDLPSYGLLTNNFTSSLSLLESGNVLPPQTTSSSATSSLSSSKQSSSSSSESLSSSSTVENTSIQSTVVTTLSNNTSTPPFPLIPIAAIIVVALLAIIGVLALARSRNRSKISASTSTPKSDPNLPEADSPGPLDQRSRAPGVLFCAKCGNPNLATNTFCSNCGEKLKKV
jgi:thermopsin